MGSVSWRARRLAVLALLLVADYAAAVRPFVPRQHSGSTEDAASLVDVVAIAVAIGAALLGAALLIGLFRGRRRRRSDDPPEHVYQPPPVSPWVKAASLLVALYALAAPVVLVLLIHAHPGTPHGSHTGATTASQAVAPTPGRRQARPSSHSSPVTYAVLGGVAVLVGGGAVLWLRRRRAAADAAGAEPALSQEPDALAHSVSAGSRALQGGGGEGRQAIIACYAAMERALTGAGAPRRPAETPIELLHKASSAGLVRLSAARELTGLFHEARFSPHPMTDTHRQHAAAALQEIDNDLRRTR